MALDKEKASRPTFADFVLSVLDRSGDKRKISFGDLVFSVLPWPFHKDLPSPNAEDDEVEENRSVKRTNC